MQRIWLISLSVVLALVPPVAIAQVAYDDASSVVYNDGWQQTDNGGYGWMGWSRFDSPTGSMALTVADSNTNGTGGLPGINTGGRALGLHAENGWIEVSRTLSSNMAANSRISMEVDTGSLSSGNRYHRFWFRSVLPAFYFVYASAGVSTYRLSLPTDPNLDTGILVNDGGIVYSLQDNGNGTYTGRLHSKRAGNGADFVWTRHLTSPIQGLGATNYFGGGAAANELYINKMEVNAVPEPASLMAVSIGVIGVLRRRARR